VLDKTTSEPLPLCPKCAQQVQDKAAKDEVSDDLKQDIPNDENSMAVASDDTADWLYASVFSTVRVIEGTYDIGDRPSDQPLQPQPTGYLSPHGRICDDTIGSHRIGNVSDNENAQTITLLDQQDVSLDMLVQQKPAASLIVDRLLEEWTTLAGGDGEGLDSKAKFRSFNMTDESGRKFSFPAHLSLTWAVRYLHDISRT